MKKILSLLIAVAMLFSLGVTAMAEETATAVAMVGSVSYTTFAEALKAASTMSGDVTVEIYDKVTLNENLSGSYSSIKFVGKDTDAEIYLDVTGYITATGKKIAFENLILSKAETGGFITNAGFMNVAFGVYDVSEVAYTECTFANGAYASSGKVTYTKCTFKRSHDKYGLWAYGNVDVVVDGCTFADYRGIKMYAEGAAKTVDLTVKNTSFSAVTDKPAIVLTYGESVTLENNTYSQTGVFELDLEGDPNGTPVTSDKPAEITCKNDEGACGVLVDGKIYTTVAQAAAVATEGSTITLLHNSTETVKLPEGVILNTNNYTAENVTVASKVAKIGEITYTTLEEAFSAATEGQTITLLADATPALTSQRSITKAAVIDLNGKTLTLKEDDLYFGTTTFKNGNIVVDPSVKPSTAVFWMFENQTLTFDNVKITATGVTGTYLIGLDGNNSDLNLLNGSEIFVNNKTALDLDIICVNASTGNDIVIEDSKVSVTNLDGRVFFRGNYTVSGTSDIDLSGITKAGFRIEAGQTLKIEDTATVDIAGEPRDGGIHITDTTAVYTVADTATVNATVNEPKLPNATVSKLNPLTLTATEHNYMVWPDGDASIERPLEIVMNFKANDTLEECEAGGYSKWLVDFNLKFTGLANGKITADNCYLAGNYGSFGWIVIPTDGLELEEGVSYPVVSAYDATLNYKDICNSVKNFTAAIHVDQAILDANPDFKVELSLVMTNPEDENDKLIIGEPAVYNAKDLSSAMPTETGYIRNRIVATAGGNIENDADKRYQVRFLAGIDSLNYKKVGFEITANGKTVVADTRTVYTKFIAINGEFLPTAFGDECKYIYSLSVNFPYTDEYKNAEVTVKPFAVTKDNKTIWAAEKTIEKIYDK